MVGTNHLNEWTIQRKYIQRFERVVVLQMMQGGLTEEQAKRHFEYAVYAEANNKWLLKPIAYEYIDQQFAIIYEDFDGQPLQQLIHKKMPLHQFLYIAIELVNACISLHQKGLLYGRLNPKYIFIHSTSLQLKVMSSTMVTKWDEQIQYEWTLSVDMDGLPYMAPEQTGRLPVGVDERTDLYLLGVLFYEMITQKSLFKSENSVDCIFDILTKKPDFTVFEKANDLTILKMIVEKLLEKNPDNRYQSAVGLKEDLIRVQKQLADGVNDILFPLGQGDQILYPKPSSKL